MATCKKQQIALFCVIFAFSLVLCDDHDGDNAAKRDDVDGHMPPSPRRHAMDARHEREHIQEHLHDVASTDTKDMTAEELEFYYFKLHDANGDNKLDGIEIGRALTHFDNNEIGAGDSAPVMTDLQMAELIDSVLKDEDTNEDGYVDYSEFVAAQKRESHGGTPDGAPPEPENQGHDQM